MVTMFLSGLWHGAGNQFLVFGLLHGVALVIAHGWRLVRPRFLARYPALSPSFPPNRLGSDISGGDGGADLVSRRLGLGGEQHRRGDDRMARHRIRRPTRCRSVAPSSSPSTSGPWCCCSIALVPPNMMEIMRDWQPAVTMPATATFGRLDLAGGLARRLNLKFSPAWALATAGFLVAGVLGLNRVSEFLYWQF